MKETYDTRTRRCPRLGHTVPFSYCRRPGSDIPCGGIYDCWWESFDVATFMERHYPAAILEQVTRPTRPRMMSLLELIKKAEKRKRSGNDSHGEPGDRA